MKEEKYDESKTLGSSQPHDDLEENESYRSDLDLSMELKEDHFVKNNLCEAHHLGGSLKEGEYNIRAAKEPFVDANALV